MTTALGILGILLASFIKGAVGFGFPAVSTPILALFKVEFVRAISFSFLVYKATQLLAVILAGLMTVDLFALSVAATALGLGAFWLGLRVQDRVAQETFNRAVLGFLAAVGVWLVLRAL